MVLLKVLRAPQHQNGPRYGRKLKVYLGTTVDAKNPAWP